MEDILYYLLKVSIATSVFYCTYHFLFRKSKHFVFNRFYLAGSFFISFIIPLITFNTPFYPGQAITYFADNDKELEFSESATYETGTEYITGFSELLLCLYLTGFLFFLIKLIHGFKIALCIRKNCTKEYINGLEVYVSKDNIRAFTFLNKIIIGKNIIRHPSLKMVLNHELVHSRERHFFDILLTELLFIMQWFNPFAKLFTMAIRNNLEFRADDLVIRESDIQDYQLAMLSMVRNRMKLPLFTELNSSNLKKRIIMMKLNNQNRFANVAKLVVIPVFALLLLSLSEREVVIASDHQNEKDPIYHIDGHADSSKDQLKSLNDLMKYLGRNINYPSEARASGQVGTIELYTRVNKNGTIEEVLEINPEGNNVEIDELVIYGYTNIESKISESSSHKSLLSESRRIVESLPKLEISELQGQTLKFKFKFLLK